MWLPSATTVSSAPISLASARASGFWSTTTIRVAHIAARAWMPMWPSPPAPWTTAVVPGHRRGTALRTAWYAVMPASASAATSAGLVEGSSLTQARAVVRRYSAIPPSLLLGRGRRR